MNMVRTVLALGLGCLLTVLSACGDDGMENYRNGLGSFDNGYYNVATEYLTLALESGELDTFHMSRAHNFRGISHFKEDRFQAAYEDYIQGITLDDTFYCFYYNLADYYVTTSDIPSAAHAYSQAMDRYPEYPYAPYNRHVANNVLENYAEAERDFAFALSLDPSLGGNYDPTNHIYILAADCHEEVPRAAGLLALARTALLDNNPGGARVLLELLLEDEDAGAESRTEASHLMVQAAYSQAGSAPADDPGFYREVLSLAGQALALESRAPALYYQGVSSLHLGDEDAAHTAFSTLLAEFPEAPLAARIPLAQGEHFLQSGQHSQAVAMYEQAIADHPDNPAARDAGMALLRAHLEQQAFADADSVAQYLLTRWQGIRFDLPEVLFLAATAKQGIGERDSARRLCLDLRNLDPGAEISLQAEAMVVDNADAHTSARVTALFGQARQGSATAPALDHDPNLTVDLGALVVELNNGRFFLARFVFLVPDQIAVWELDTKAVPLRDLIARYMANEDPARFVELEASALAATVLAMANEQLVHGHVEQTLLVHSALSTP